MEARPLNLDEIEARANAATPGPWEFRSGWDYVHAPDADVCTVHVNTYANAAFIAAARTDVPALIAEVRRLRERDVANDSALMFERDWKDACRERDEARAEVEAMRKAIMHAFPVFTESDEDECTWNECIEAAVQNLRELRRERNEAIDEVERLRAACVGSDLAEHYYRRGAEAMREACATMVLTSMSWQARPDERTADEIAESIRALPIPEEP